MSQYIYIYILTFFLWARDSRHRSWKKLSTFQALEWIYDFRNKQQPFKAGYRKNSIN